MNPVEHMMKLYEEGIDELMGAQKYSKCSVKAASESERTMYKNMARQELEHAQMLIRDGDKLFMEPNAADSLSMVWKSLREHLLDWHGSLMQKLS